MAAEQVAFANRADGWLYDQYNSGHMWVTHNGGKSWREVTLPGNVQTVTASANAVYAVAGNHLYRSPLPRDAWRQVSPGPRSGVMTGKTLAVSGHSVWFGSDTSLWTTADGARWERYQVHSPGSYSFVTGSPGSSSGSQLLRTTDAGRTWHAVRS